MMRRVLIVLLALMALPSSTLIAEDDFYHPPGVLLDCSVCHRFQDADCCECDNIKGIKCWISIPNPGEGDPERQVVFTSRTELYSFADGNETYDGVCEVCHTYTSHHTNDGHHSEHDGEHYGHHPGEDCITCHKHTNEFMYEPPPG